MALAAGTRLGPYEIVAALGAGGMGEVYQARDTRLDRTVAIKVLPPDVSADPVRRARFEREAKTVAALSHAHICPLFDVGVHEGALFLVMEHLQGQTLAERLSKGPLRLEPALTIGAEMAEALAAAHQRGVVHRDLKPGNVMLTASGAKLLDFGLAKAEGCGEPAGLAAADLAPTREASLTVDGAVVGTLQYMAPEQLEHKPTDARTDIWALGAVLYEMITGRRAFSADSQSGLIAAILDRHPVPLSAIEPSSPPALDRLIRECLAKDPTMRRRSAADLADDLRTCTQRLGAPHAADPGAPTVRGLPSIAVLPFANISADAEQQYFCDGMTEELITALGAIEGLRVAAATSTFYLKGQALETREIGRRLNVETLLEGSVRRSGNRLRVTAQLVNVSDGYHLWAERYDREMHDVFAMQDDIARAIVEKLKVRLVAAGDRPIVKRASSDLEAYELYLQGRYYFARRFKGGLEGAVECFSRAVALDREFAAAHAGLALSLAAMGFWGYAVPQHVRPGALEAAERGEGLSPADEAGRLGGAMASPSPAPPLDDRAADIGPKPSKRPLDRGCDAPDQQRRYRADVAGAGVAPRATEVRLHADLGAHSVFTLPKRACNARRRRGARFAVLALRYAATSCSCTPNVSVWERQCPPEIARPAATDSGCGLVTREAA